MRPASTRRSPPTTCRPACSSRSGSRWRARACYTGERIAPDQALSREDALRCATIEGAWLTFEEDRKGSLEVGKLADLAILSDDPLTCPQDAIRDIVAETVIVGGRTVLGG